MTQNPFLIAPTELAEQIGRDGLSIVDASWYLPAQTRDARAEYDAGHIPGAAFFDQDAVVDPASSLPHTLPSPEFFSEAVGNLGISETDTIVVYDGIGLFSAPRVWWMFRTFGAKDVRLLDGGYPAWTDADLRTETGASARQPKTFAASFDRDAVASLDEMREIVDGAGRQVIDVRPADRFAGTVAEPRAGVRAGHMPGAKNLPFLMLGKDGRLKSSGDLRKAMTEAGIDPDAPSVTSCGSGVTAAVLNLAMASVGNTDVKLYDGSWTEWGSAKDTPVETET